jgi:hypothetical protein
MSALFTLCPIFLALASLAAPIDRHALVSRHNVVLTSFDGDRPLQVGNGNFAFGIDITGLQTFAAFNTMSDWGWNSSPLPPGTAVSDYQGQVWDTHGRPVRYPMFDPAHPAISEWLAGNPHRINLGRIGFVLKRADGSDAEVGDLQATHQELDLWTGTVTSRFELEGQPVSVKTACDPDIDSVAGSVDSPLVSSGRLSVFFEVPGDDGAQFANRVGDWAHPATLKQLPELEPNRASFTRELGQNSYHLDVAWDGSGTMQRRTPSESPVVIHAEYGAGSQNVDVTDVARRSVQDGRLSIRAGNSLAADPAPKKVKTLSVTYSLGGTTKTVTVNENEDVIVDPMPHRLVLQPSGKSTHFSFVCRFAKTVFKDRPPSAQRTFADSQRSWPAYWKTGGAIDLSGSKDPRWSELERRIVLSQYLMAVNEAGIYPPQESGLVNNGWFGRWHMEMYWWHAAHWALWNRWPQLEKSLNIYADLLPSAEALAKKEGYEGARWPKCIGPNLVEWPHVIHSLLIWQQPHPLFFAELDYRAHPTQATLKKWWPVVKATADFLATYAYWDSATKRYILGPPVVLASENTEPTTTYDPTYELGYWRFGLRVAQEWSSRLGLRPNPAWEKVRHGLAPLPVQDGVYVLHEGVKEMWTKWNFEHPALTSVLGILPGDGVDPATMKRTLSKVQSTWQFERTWGWDYPMLAMCAARTGDPAAAIDFLLTKSGGFQFDERGLATGGPFPYFPSNGGLLYAVAMMTAGWDGAASKHAPGFPADGSWQVRSEGLSAVP